MRVKPISYLNFSAPDYSAFKPVSNTIKSDNFQHKNTTEKQSPGTGLNKKLFLSLALAGALVLAGIYFVRRGLKVKAIPDKPNPINQPVVQNYLSDLTKGLKAAFGLDLAPENLSNVMNRNEFLSAISKLKKENYIASKENIANGIFRADLHSHSNFSDGKGSVENILNGVSEYANKLYAKTKEKFIFALTDHDTAQGAKEALKIIAQNPEKFKNIKFVVGAELSYLIKSNKTANPCENFELLAYGFNPFAKNVENFFQNIKAKRLLTRQNYIKDLAAKFPDTKFSEEEFLKIFLRNKSPQNPLMNSYWQIYHYGQIKKVLSDTAKWKKLNPEQYFADCMAKAPQKPSLYSFKQAGIIENWINENSEIIKINNKYKPSVDAKGNIVGKCETIIEDIVDAFKGEKECTIGFAHPYYISERNSNVEGIVNEAKSKLGDLFKVTESYHMAYSDELLKNSSNDIQNIAKMCESKNLIPIGGRDNHGVNFLGELI